MLDGAPFESFESHNDKRDAFTGIELRIQRNGILLQIKIEKGVPRPSNYNRRHST